MHSLALHTAAVSVVAITGVTPTRSSVASGLSLSTGAVAIGACGGRLARENHSLTPLETAAAGVTTAPSTAPSASSHNGGAA